MYDYRYEVMIQKWKKFTWRRCWKIFPEAMFFSFEKTFFKVSAQNLCHHFTWYHWLRKFSFIFQPIIQSCIPELWSCNFALLLQGPLYLFHDMWMGILLCMKHDWGLIFLHDSWIYIFTFSGNCFLIFSWSVKCACTYTWFVN